MTTLDSEILHWIHLNRMESLDGLLRFVSAANTWVSIGMIIVVALLGWFHRQGWKKALQLTMTLVAAALLTFVLKELVGRERPFNDHETIQKLAEGGSTSFPSGHSLEVFAMTFSLGLLFRKKWVWAIGMLWALLVAYSRMALGVHYPGDVMGGMLFGILLASGIHILFKRFSPPYNHN